MHPPKTPEDLFAILHHLKIPITTHTHEPVFTTSEAESVKQKIKGPHVKNLFLKNKKKEYLLITMLDDKRLNLKTFAQEMNYGTLSFASNEDLFHYLGIEPGHVTPFALIHPESKNVKVILDKDLMENDILNFHPLKNHMTTTISNKDFLQFLHHTGHKPLVVSLPKC